MLTKKKQRRYLADKEEQWLHQLKAFGDSHDEEALHRLRVEIKKIRALVKLTATGSGRRATGSGKRATGSGKRATGHFRGLKQMFKQAGMIRDAASQARWLEQRQLLPPEERERRAASRRVAGETFAAQIGRFRQNGRKASRRLLSDVHSIHAGRIRRWFAREILAIGMMLSKQEAEMHDARKKIKTILYVHKLLPSAIKQRIPLNTGYLDRLQDAIGEWHDAAMVYDQAAGEGDRTESDIKREVRDKERVVKDLANEFAVELHRCQAF